MNPGFFNFEYQSFHRVLTAVAIESCRVVGHKVPFITLPRTGNVAAAERKNKIDACYIIFCLWRFSIEIISRQRRCFKRHRYEGTTPYKYKHICRSTIYRFVQNKHIYICLSSIYNNLYMGLYAHS